MLPHPSEAALLVSAYVVSLACFAGALWLLAAAGRARAGPRVAAARRVWLLALFPASLFFGAPYSESLFLLVSVGAFYAARTGRWAWAGALAARGRGHPQRGDRAARPAAAPLARLAAAARPATSRGSGSRRSGSRPTRSISGSRTTTRSRSSTRRRSGTASSPGRSWASGTGRPRPGTACGSS